MNNPKDFSCLLEEIHQCKWYSKKSTELGVRRPRFESSSFCFITWAEYFEECLLYHLQYGNNSDGLSCLPGLV